MKQLLNILLERCKEIEGIADVRLFNNQLQNLEDETLFYPAILIQIPSVRYESGSNNTQFGYPDITFHIINNSPLQGSELDIYELKEEVDSWLHKYTTGYFSPLVKTGETLDMKHNNLYDFQITYTTRFSEKIIKKNSIQTAPINTIIVDVIDKEVIVDTVVIGEQPEAIPETPEPIELPFPIQFPLPGGNVG